MKSHFPKLSIAAVSLILGISSVAAGPFSSGSTGADGAFAPTANIVVPLPPSGIIHYTTVNIPAGVTVKFSKNANNTPVVILATGDVTIAGTIDVRGGNSPTTTGSAVTNGHPGLGGPGGFDGGRGGLPGTASLGGTGYGPGGGFGGTYPTTDRYAGGGGGAGFNTGGEGSWRQRNNNSGFGGAPGGGYGTNGMLPLVGGAGGGGGSGGVNAWSLAGGGGGGGGGAVMIVASGAVTVSGSVNASGGSAGNINGGNCDYGIQDAGAGGGGGSGGFIRLIAPLINGSGNLVAGGGAGGCRSENGLGGTNVNGPSSGGWGAMGRVHVETISKGSFDIAAIPTLAVTAIGSVPVGPNAGDISLPLTLGNPLQVDVAASGIPVGTVVKLTLTHPYGSPVSVNTSALAGTLQSTTATGSMSIPSGATVLIASTTYTLTVAQGEALKVYAGGERVEKVELASQLGGGMQATLITFSGKEFIVPTAVLTGFGLRQG